MTTPVSVLPAGVLGNDGSPAGARVCSNTRVLAATGALGLVTDVMQFAGPAVSGSWILGASRVQQLLQNLEALALADSVEQAVWARVEALTV